MTDRQVDAFPLPITDLLIKEQTIQEPDQPEDNEREEACLALIERRRREVEAQIAFVAERIEAKHQAAALRRRRVQLAQSTSRLEQSTARLRDMLRQLKEIDDNTDANDRTQENDNAETDSFLRHNNGADVVSAGGKRRYSDEQSTAKVRKIEEQPVAPTTSVAPVLSVAPVTSVAPMASVVPIAAPSTSSVQIPDNVMALWLILVGPIHRRQLDVLIGYRGRNELGQFKRFSLSPYTKPQCKAFMICTRYLFPWRTCAEYEVLLKHHPPTVTWLALWQMPSNRVWPLTTCTFSGDKRRLQFLQRFVIALWPLAGATKYLVHLRGRECQQFSNGFVVFCASLETRFFNSATMSKLMTQNVQSQYSWGLRGDEAMRVLGLQE